MYYVTNKVYLKMYKIISIIFIEYSLINFVIMLELLIYIYIYYFQWWNKRNSDCKSKLNDLTTLIKYLIALIIEHATNWPINFNPGISSNTFQPGYRYLCETRLMTDFWRVYQISSLNLFNKHYYDR